MGRMTHSKGLQVRPETSGPLQRGQSLYTRDARSTEWATRAPHSKHFLNHEFFSPRAKCHRFCDFLHVHSKSYQSLIFLLGWVDMSWTSKRPYRNIYSLNLLWLNGYSHPINNKNSLFHLSFSKINHNLCKKTTARRRSCLIRLQSWKTQLLLL